MPRNPRPIRKDPNLEVTQVIQALSGGSASGGGGFGGGGPLLSDQTPLVESGAGDPGVGEEASRWDHVHPAASGATVGFFDGMFFDCRCNGTSAPAPHLTNCSIQFSTFSGSATAAYNSTLGSWAWNWVVTANNVRRATLNDGGATTPACYSRDMYPSLEGSMMFNAFVDTQYFFGFSAGDPIGFPTATAPSNSMYFRYADDVDTNWQCVCRAGGAEAVVDSGVLVSTNTKYKLKMLTNSVGDVEFYINDALVHTESSTLPVAATKISAQVGHIIFQKAASAASADVTIQGIRFSAPSQ